MKISEFKKLIREEVRKVIKERSSLNEFDDQEANDAIKGIKLMVAAFKQMPADEAKFVKLIKGQTAAGIMKLLADVLAKGSATDEKLELLQNFSRKLNAANTLDTVETAMIEIIETLRDLKSNNNK